MTCRVHHAAPQGNRLQVNLTSVYLELLTSANTPFFSQLLKSVDCAAAEYDQDTHHHLDSSQVPVFPESAQKNVLEETMSKCHPYGRSLGGTMPSVPGVEGAYSDNQWVSVFCVVFYVEFHFKWDEGIGWWNKKSKILLLRKGKKRMIEKLLESFLNFKKPRLKKNIEFKLITIKSFPTTFPKGQDWFTISKETYLSDHPTAWYEAFARMNNV